MNSAAGELPRYDSLYASQSEIVPKCRLIRHEIVRKGWRCSVPAAEWLAHSLTVNWRIPFIADRQGKVGVARPCALHRSGREATRGCAMRAQLLFRCHPS